MRRVPLFLDILAGFIALAVVSMSITFPSWQSLPWLKATPALCWALSFLMVRGQGWPFMALALIAAAAGDWLLGHANLFVFGAAAFAVMQILYGAWFWVLALRSRLPRWRLVAAPLFYGLVSSLLLFFCATRVGDLALPMAAYAMVLTFMASGSALRGGVLAGGGALFFLSDSLILIFQAWPPSSPSDWAILIPYYIGQALIVRAIRRL